jgi:hypothetical protein
VARPRRGVGHRESCRSRVGWATGSPPSIPGSGSQATCHRMRSLRPGSMGRVDNILWGCVVHALLRVRSPPRGIVRLPWRLGWSGLPPRGMVRLLCARVGGTPRRLAVDGGAERGAGPSSAGRCSRPRFGVWRREGQVPLPAWSRRWRSACAERLIACHAAERRPDHSGASANAGSCASWSAGGRPNRPARADPAP